MKQQDATNPATQSSRTQITILLVVSALVVLIGLLMIVNGIAGGALFGGSSKDFQTGEKIGKGVFMLAGGLVGSILSMRFLRKAKK